jgi:biotin carboxyl carrier protein
MKRDVVVNGSPGQIQVEGDRMRYDREGSPAVIADFEMRELEAGSYWVRLGKASYRVTVGSAGEVSVNGRALRMEVFDPRDLRASGKGAANHGRQEIAAPMPGKVVRVLVAVGDAVTEGQGVVVVEAMKMQNEMKSPKAGTVVEVKTRADATVAAGEVLVVIE